MKTLVDLKRRCMIGTVIEVTRLKYKPTTYFAVVAEHKAQHLGLVTTDRTDPGHTAWGRAQKWQFTEDTATRLSNDGTSEALLRFRFLSEDELAALPAEVKALSQRYQPETAATAAGTAVRTEPLRGGQGAAGTVEHSEPSRPPTAGQRVSRVRPIAETPTASTLTEAQFWDAQQAVHQCLLELSKEAAIREACYNVSKITFKHYPQVEVRDARIELNGEWQAALVVRQAEALWFYELTGDLHTFHPAQLSLATATEKRVRRLLDSTKVPIGLRAILAGIQQLPTDELRSQALLLLDKNTKLYLTRYAQTPFLLDLAASLQDLEIMVAPQRVRTTDGFTLERQPDGSYSNGNLTYESLTDLDYEHDWEEVG